MLRKKIWWSLALVALFTLLPGAALAQGAEPTKEVIAIDTVWVVLAAILVFFMQAGFVLLEAGFSRGKNVGHIAVKNLVIFSVASLAFWAAGFAIAFGDGNDYFGSSAWFLAVSPADVNTAVSSLAYSTVPLSAKFLFQLVFAAVSLAIVWGAMAERTKLMVYVIFGIVFTTVIYPVVAHWMWGGGWLFKLGFQDFAGSTIVHLQGAAAGLAGALLLGPRLGKYAKDGTPRGIPGHNMAYVVTGVLILWLGWFGFNPGSTLAAVGASFADIALNTNLAAAAGVVGAFFTAWMLLGKPDIGMIGNGAIAALVAITAPCAFVDPWAAVLIGLIAGVIMVFAIVGIDRVRLDDPVGAVSVHGISGIWGTLSAGLFATPALTEALKVGQPGLFYGGGIAQLVTQITGIAAAFTYVFIVSLLVFFLIKITIGLRVSAEDELEGLDISEHGMWGYPEQFLGETGSLDRTGGGSAVAVSRQPAEA